MWCIFRLGDLMGRVTMPTSTEPSSTRWRIFVTEVTVDADVHQGIAALKFRKNVGEQIEAGGFIGAEDDRALKRRCRGRQQPEWISSRMRNNFSAYSKKNFTGGSQLDGFGERSRRRPCRLARAGEFCALTADCERNTFWPAREKLLSLATKTKVVSWSKSIIRTSGRDYSEFHLPDAELNILPLLGPGRGQAPPLQKTSGVKRSL